jgi:hypothetical protein
MKDRKSDVDESGDVFENVTISGGVVGALGGRGHHIEQTSAGSTAPTGDSPVAQDSDLADVRDLLLAAFTDADLRRLFVYTMHTELQPLAQEFSEGDGLAAMVDKTIQFCQTRDLLPDLLREVKRARPRHYARYESQK